MNNCTARLKYIDMIIFLLFFSIVKIYAIPKIMQQGLKIASIFVVFLYIFSNCRKKMINEGSIMVFLFLIPSFWGLLTGNLTVRVFLDGLLNAMCIFLLFMCMKYSSEKGCLKRVLDEFYYLTLFSCLISLISVICNGSSRRGTEMEYFFGNKYSTTYLFMLLVGLAYQRFYNQKKCRLEHKLVLAVLIVTAIGISYWVRCYTTLIGSMVLPLAISVPSKQYKNLQNVLSSPIASLIYVVMPGIMAMNMAIIMQIPKIKNFVTGVLGKSAGLTGRVYIYSRLKELILHKFLFGYGYNSNIVERVTEVGNAQNGILELVIDYGIIGVFVMIVIIYRAFSVSKENREFWGLKVFIIAMSVCSIVEISFNYLFFLAIFILRFPQSTQRKILKFRYQKLLI